MPHAVACAPGCLTALRICAGAGPFECFLQLHKPWAAGRHLAGLLLHGGLSGVPWLAGAVCGLLRPLIWECFCSHWQVYCCLGVARLTDPLTAATCSLHAQPSAAYAKHGSPHLMHLLTYTLIMLQPYVDLRTGELMAEVRCMLCCLSPAFLVLRAECLCRKHAPRLHKHSARKTTCILMFMPHCHSLPPGPFFAHSLQTALLADSSLLEVSNLVARPDVADLAIPEPLA